VPFVDHTEAGCAKRKEVCTALRRFYTDQVPIDTLTITQRKDLAADNLEIEDKLTKPAARPYYVVQSPERKVLAPAGGFIEAPNSIKFLTDAPSKFDGDMQVARAETSPDGR
jgi:hypothetical protein